MIFKQSNIMNLLESIKERIEETDNDVVYFSIDDVLSILKLSQTKVEYNGGMDLLADNLSGQRQFE